MKSMNKATKISISLPSNLLGLVDAMCGGNRSEWISKTLADKLEQQGLLGESAKARLVAAIQSVEGDLTESKLKEILNVLSEEERESVKKEAVA